MSPAGKLSSAAFAVVLVMAGCLVGALPTPPPLPRDLADHRGPTTPPDQEETATAHTRGASLENNASPLEPCLVVHYQPPPDTSGNLQQATTGDSAAVNEADPDADEESPSGTDDPPVDEEPPSMPAQAAPLPAIIAVPTWRSCSEKDEFSDPAGKCRKRFITKSG